MTDNTNMPQYEAFVINETANEKKHYTKVGSGWAHKNGTGINLVIANGISVSGNIVIFPYTKRENQEPTE